MTSVIYDEWARKQIRDSDDKGHAVLIKFIVHSISSKAIALIKQGADQRGDVAWSTAGTALMRCSCDKTEAALLIIKEIERIRDEAAGLFSPSASDDTEDDDVHLPDLT